MLPVPSYAGLLVLAAVDMEGVGERARSPIAALMYSPRVWRVDLLGETTRLLRALGVGATDLWIRGL